MENFEHINKIELQGRIGTVRTNEYNGSRVANFSLITETLYKNKEGAAVSEAIWHNIVFWAGKDCADFNKITKGAPANVTGRLRVNKYTSAEGTEKLFYEVIANSVNILQG